jgi:hypothetical protein
MNPSFIAAFLNEVKYSVTLDISIFLIRSAKWIPGNIFKNGKYFSILLPLHLSGCLQVNFLFSHVPLIRVECTTTLDALL